MYEENAMQQLSLELYIIFMIHVWSESNLNSKYCPRKAFPIGLRYCRISLVSLYSITLDDSGYLFVQVHRLGLLLRGGGSSHLRDAQSSHRWLLHWLAVPPARGRRMGGVRAPVPRLARARGSPKVPRQQFHVTGGNIGAMRSLPRLLPYTYLSST